MGREEGGGFRMGNTGIPVADSFRYLAKLIQYCKVKKKKKEYWSGLPFPSPGDPPHPGTKLEYPAWLADSIPLRHLGSP